MMRLIRLQRKQPLAVTLVLIGLISGALYLGAGDLVLNSGRQANRVYDETLSSWLTRYAEGLENFDNVTANPQPSNSAWMTSFQSGVDAIKLINQEIYTYNPPFTSLTWHQGLKTDVASGYDRFLDLYTQWLETNSTDTLNRAQAERKRADERRMEFSRLLKRVSP